MRCQIMGGGCLIRGPHVIRLEWEGTPNRTAPEKLEVLNAAQSYNQICSARSPCVGGLNDWKFFFFFFSLSQGPAMKAERKDNILC